MPRQLSTDNLLTHELAMPTQRRGLFRTRIRHESRPCKLRTGLPASAAYCFAWIRIMFPAGSRTAQSRTP